MYSGYGHAAYDTAPDYRERILDFLKKQIPAIFSYVPYKDEAKIKEALKKADELTKKFRRQK